MAEMVAENTVKTVEPKLVKKGTPEQRTIYDVVDVSDVKWTVWERELAEKAFGLKGVTSLWKVDISQNGSYTNRTLKEIQAKAANGFEPALNAMEASLGTLGTGMGGSLDGGSLDGFKAAVVDEPDFKDRTIWRQTATKVAAHLQAGTELEFWTNVDMLVKFYETGEKPGSVDPFGQAAQTAKNPDDDIPF